MTQIDINGTITDEAHSLAGTFNGYFQFVFPRTRGLSESEELDILSVILQESVLGPILFLIFLHNIHSYVEPDVTVRLFADDCVIYTTVQTIDDQIQLNTSLTNILGWCHNWGMEINVRKTSYIRIT